MMKKYTLSHGDTSLELYPERGGIITSIMFGKQEILYQGMLGKTLHDMSKSIRGGIPVLFPQAGPVSNEEEIILGYSLPQHGVVRQRTWDIEKIDTSSAILNFKSAAHNTEFP